MSMLFRSLACCVAFLVLVAESAHGQNRTHLGVPADNLVILSGDSFTYDPGGDSILGPTDFPLALVFTTRILPDGTEVEDYRIPENKALVVTDINWGYRGSRADTQYCLTFEVSTTDPPFGPAPNAHRSCMTVNDLRVGNVSESLTTGFVVQDNHKLYTPGPSDPGRGGSDTGGQYLGRSDGSDVLLRGYLVDERRGGGRSGLDLPRTGDENGRRFQ